ncbi:hypothetical protein HDU88_007305 [Geranomyces variabilis]|nr:hypothetical protein HDU88_007305 [Geranomyces variabilis]
MQKSATAILVEGVPTSRLTRCWSGCSRSGLREDIGALASFVRDDLPGRPNEYTSVKLWCEDHAKLSSWVFAPWGNNRAIDWAIMVVQEWPAAGCCDDCGDQGEERSPRGKAPSDAEVCYCYSGRRHHHIRLDGQRHPLYPFRAYGVFLSQPHSFDNHADQELVKFIWRDRLTAEQRQMLEDKAQAERNFVLPSEVDNALEATQTMEEDCSEL